jgi:hypothetical protein
MFKWVPEMGTVGIADYPVNALVDVAATGSACILIHRSVFEAIREEYGDTWYDRVPNPYVGELHGEDISFCLRAGALGFPVHVHTGIRTTHLKHIWLSDVDYWNYRPAPPASERTAVIVPVLDRPQNAEPFMASLRASTGLADVYAVIGPDDTVSLDAWQAQGAKVLEASGESFAVKVNEAFRATTEPFVFVTGDDVRFYPGWLDHAQHVAELHQAHVIGTNDLGNPRVVSGDHGTYLLIRRSYVDEQGASWDGLGAVCHEGYGHWYVDDEIVTAAKQRGVWASALGSVVEHLHPLWGKAEDDDTYRKGQASQAADYRLFRKRYARFGKVKP